MQRHRRLDFRKVQATADTASKGNRKDHRIIGAWIVFPVGGSVEVVEWESDGLVFEGVQQKGLVDGREVGKGGVEVEGLGESVGVGAKLNGIGESATVPEANLDNAKHNTTIALFFFIFHSPICLLTQLYASSFFGIAHRLFHRWKDYWCHLKNDSCGKVAGRTCLAHEKK